MDFRKALELVNKSKNILLTTHTKPDGDACGCIAAMFETLAAIGKNVKPLLLTDLPDWYAFLFAQRPAILGRDVTIEQLKQGQFFNPDLILIVDTNSHNQLDTFDEYLKQNNKPILVIDHHVTSDGLGDIELIDTSAAACGLIVLDFLKYAGWKITPAIARSLFVAISTDTGWFHFRNTDSRAYRGAADLIDAGANPNDIYHQLYQSFSPQRFKLMVAMLGTIELHFDGRFATQYLRQSDFQKTGAAYVDTENLIDECQRINNVEAAALFVELKDGKIKCSLRSRGAVDVREIAQKYGGGGHTMAAGLHLSGPLENAMQTIKAEVKKKMIGGS